MLEPVVQAAEERAGGNHGKPPPPISHMSLPTLPTTSWRVREYVRNDVPTVSRRDEEARRKPRPAKGRRGRRRGEDGRTDGTTQNTQKQRRSRTDGRPQLPPIKNLTKTDAMKMHARPAPETHNFITSEGIFISRSGAMTETLWTAEFIGPSAKKPGS